jgi:hypothetical protein
MTAPTPPASADLIERLGDLADMLARGGLKKREPVARQAIDLIRSLEAQVIKLDAEVERWVNTTSIAQDQAMENGSRLSAAEEENKRLRDGLAEIADGKVGPENNWHAHWWRLVKMARALLSGREK